ncbi:G-type lectin S-receptor-like serine/threonine-protein kinase isoform X2 [Salvia divinorum]|uniref:Receptor-like serine/threonine-protein kinase n=1 Tax=Salvia divinorum TaxID=28513 RepID=A0ABD1I249_SALDI
MKFLYAALYLLTIPRFSFADDRLSANQTLADGDLLISQSQIFELGFFSPGSSTSRFLGIWYKATPDIVVWVANRENPITGLNGVLTLSETGNLIITSAQGPTIWSSNSSTTASGPVLQLLNSGNLVVGQNSSYIWQSFDHPGDTRLPGMTLMQNIGDGDGKYLTSWKSGDDPSMGELSYRIQNQGLSQTIIAKGKEILNRVVFWNGNFVGYPTSQDPAWRVEVETNKGRLVSVRQPYYDSVHARLTMNYSGFLQRYVMNEEKDGWILMIALPHDLCDGYDVCGSNGICKIYKNPVCECLRGFHPASESEWSVFEWRGGCTRNLSLDCQREEGFLEVKGIKFPDSLNFRLNTNMTNDECRDECLNNCNCTAYADPFFSNGSSCMMWFGDLIDMREYTTESGPAPSIHIRVPISELDNKGKGLSRKTIIVIATVSTLAMLILGVAVWGVFMRIRRKRRGYIKRLDSKMAAEELELPLFDLATIEAATDSFSEQNLIGQGGFGPVYKGNLSVGEVIAVKRMSKISGQGHEEFKTEINLIAKLQHRNLVRILGCCVEGEEKMLIYEYMINRSLDHFIFDQRRRALLNWSKRFEIIMGIARGLLYLHHDSRLNVIHRDLKTSNILLDENLNAKISDFGLARMFEGDQTISTTTRVVGTYGYMAPEYAFDGKFSIKSDIYSLGVMILEIVSGQKNRGFKHPSCYKNLLEQAWHFCKEGRELEMMDPCYKNSYVESQVKRCVQVGSLCIQNVAEERPMMPAVVLMLSTEDAVLPQPRKPGFFLHGDSSFSQSNASGSTGGAVTITDIEAR